MIKILYSFELSKEEEVEQQVESINESNEKVVITKKVKQPVVHKFHVARPSRGLIEQGELFRAKKFSEALKHGILTHDLLSKRLQNDDGVLSEAEKKLWKELYDKLFSLQNELHKLSEKKDEEKTEEEKKQFIDLTNELREVRQKIRNFELAKSSLFEMTAEQYARNKTIFWYLVYLSYKTNAKNEPEPLFPGKDFEEKAGQYDIVEETNDPFMNQVVRKFMYYVTLWTISEVSNAEQFAQLVKEIEEEEKQQNVQS